MADVKSFQKLRRLGGLEKFSSSRHHINFYNNVGVTAAYSVSSSTVPLQLLVFNGLRILIDRHPILSAIPLDEGSKKAYFVRLPTVDLRTCVQFIERNSDFSPERSSGTDAELDAILEQQHNTVYKDAVGTKPFWRVIILHPPGSTTEFTVSWVFHHALADGTSGLVFHRTFLSALQSLSTSDLVEDPVVKSPSTPLIPTLDSLHRLPLTALYLSKEQWRDWFPKRAKTLWTGSTISSSPSTSITKFRTLVLSKDSTSTLVNLSREHKTTLSGTLQCIAAAAVLANLDHAKYDSIEVDGAISLRRFLSLKTAGPKFADRDINDELGAYVSQFNYTHILPPSSSRSTSTSTPSALELFSWAEARSVRDTITAELAKNGTNSKVALLRWVPDLPAFFLGKVGKHRTETFEITNVGVFRPAKHELPDGTGHAQGTGSEGRETVWKIGRVIFSQSAAVAGAAFEFSIATGADGCCVLAFSWLNGVVEGSMMEKIMGSVGDCIEGILRGDVKG